VGQSSGSRENCGLKGERLVAVAPGGASTGSEGGSDEPVPVDGGRIVVFDFERGHGTLRGRSHHY
jgi:hypothetical protein